MSAARIIPFPIAAQPHPADLSHAMEGPTDKPHAATPPVTTVIVTPTPGEGWVPPLSQRYPSVFASFAHWAAAERIGEDLVIR